MASDPPKVLISYSHKDNQYGNDLETHLEPYLQEGSLTSWSDKQIQPGSQGPDALSGLAGRVRFKRPSFSGELADPAARFGERQC